MSIENMTQLMERLNVTMGLMKKIVNNVNLNDAETIEQLAQYIKENTKDIVSREVEEYLGVAYNPDRNPI